MIGGLSSTVTWQNRGSTNLNSQLQNKQKIIELAWDIGQGYQIMHRTLQIENRTFSLQNCLLPQAFGKNRLRLEGLFAEFDVGQIHERQLATVAFTNDVA